MPHVQMRIQVSGTRDGVDWPAPGELLEVDDAEAADLIRAGIAAEPETVEETASVDDEPETATARRRKS